MSAQSPARRPARRTACREARIARVRGERRLMRWNNRCCARKLGDVIETASIGEDITERKRHETDQAPEPRLRGAERHQYADRARARPRRAVQGGVPDRGRGTAGSGWPGSASSIASAMKMVPVASAGDGRRRSSTARRRPLVSERGRGLGLRWPRGRSGETGIVSQRLAERLRRVVLRQQDAGSAASARWPCLPLIVADEGGRRARAVRAARPDSSTRRR